MADRLTKCITRRTLHAGARLVSGWQRITSLRRNWSSGSNSRCSCRPGFQAELMAAGSGQECWLAMMAPKAAAVGR